MKRTSKFKAKLLAALIFPVYRVLGATWRARVRGYDHYERLRDSKRAFIISGPHGRIVASGWQLREVGMATPASHHRDGELAFQLNSFLGYPGFRGSSTRGGTRVLREMCRAPAHVPIGFTFDGPRGPEGRVSRGIVQLARLSERPILPIGVAADRAWRTKSWDRQIIPKPFARLGFVFGEPVEIPADLSRDDIEEWTRKVQKVMHEVDRAAWELVGNEDSTAPLPPAS